MPLSKNSISQLDHKDLKGLQSLRRAFSILRVVSENNDRGIRLSAICAEVALKTTTTHRLLSSLVGEEMVTYSPFSKCYHLGFQLYKLGHVANQYSILQYCHDALERIAGETTDTVFLSIRSGSSAMCIKRVEGAYPVRTLTIDEGSRRPLGIGASSLAILANLPDEEINQIIKLNRKSYADYNQTEADVRSLIRLARKLGYVFYDRILSDDVIAVGLPILDQGGKVVAAISVAAIPSRMDRKRVEKIGKFIKSEIGNVSIPSP
jgi:DNA-binding IclR family transcriptional regulator